METCKVLLVDDRAGEIRWLLDLISSRGYTIDLATNQESAMRQLKKVKDGEVSYSLAIFDVMVAIMDLMDIVDLDDESLYVESRDTGIRLCEYARRELRITDDELPIVCLSARDDPEVKEKLAALGIRLFNRAPQNPEDSIRKYVMDQLPVRIA